MPWARMAALRPAVSESNATRIPVRARSAAWLSWAACWLVSAVPQGASPAMLAGVGDGDGDGVERPFGDDGDGAPGEGGAGLVQAEQQVAFLVGGGLGAVEVFRHVRPGIGAGAAGEPGQGAAGVVDGEHDPVPEPVDEGAAGGAGGEPGGLDHVVVVAEAAQVAGEGGPPGGGVPDLPVPDGGGVMPRACR